MNETQNIKLNQNQNEEADKSLDIPNLSLVQSQSQAEQEVVKALKDNSVYNKEEEEKLSKELCSGEN